MATLVEERTKTWQKKEENALQTKEAGAFDVMLTKTCKRLAAGKYRVQWNLDVSCLNSGMGSIPKARCQVDGSTIGSVIGSDTTEWCTYSGWDFRTFAEGARPVIEVQLRRVGGADTVQIRRIKVSIELMEE